MFTIQPRSLRPGNRSCLSICAMAYLQQRKTPLALMAIVLSQSLSLNSWIPCGLACVDSTEIPALQQIMSSRPNTSTHLAIAPSTSVAFVTSAFTKSARPAPYSLSISASVVSPSTRLLKSSALPVSGFVLFLGLLYKSTQQIFAPSPASLRHIERPRPDEAPVT